MDAFHAFTTDRFSVNLFVSVGVGTWLGPTDRLASLPQVLFSAPPPFIRGTFGCTQTDNTRENQWIGRILSETQRPLHKGCGHTNTSTVYTSCSRKTFQILCPVGGTTSLTGAWTTQCSGPGLPPAKKTKPGMRPSPTLGAPFYFFPAKPARWIPISNHLIAKSPSCCGPFALKTVTVAGKKKQLEIHPHLFGEKRQTLESIHVFLGEKGQQLEKIHPRPSDAHPTCRRADGPRGADDGGVAARRAPGEPPPQLRGGWRWEADGVSLGHSICPAQRKSVRDTHTHNIFAHKERFFFGGGKTGRLTAQPEHRSG